MKPSHPLHGLVAAAHTPFKPDGSLNLAVVERQAAHLLRKGITIAFIGGTTGECHALSLEERRALARRGGEVARGTALKLSVHVGSNGLADARVLAAEAEALGAISISAGAPNYFKPPNLDVLIRLLRGRCRGGAEHAVRLLSNHGYMGAAKATMAMLRVDVGPARLPNGALSDTQRRHLRAELEDLGFFDWIEHPTGGESLWEDAT